MSISDPHADAPRRRRGRGRPAGTDSEAVNARLMAAALKHFVLHGFEGASIQRIAREAGVARQLIYQRHGDKRGFFDAVMTHRETRFFATIGFPHEHEAGRPSKVLLDYARHMAAYLLSPQRIELARIMYGGLYRYPDIIAFEREARERGLATVAGYLEQAMAADGAAPIDAMDAARDFRSLINGLATPVVLGLCHPPSEAERECRVRGIVERFMRGIGLRFDTRDAGCDRPGAGASASGITGSAS